MAIPDSSSRFQCGAPPASSNDSMSQAHGHMQKKEFKRR